MRGAGRAPSKVGLMRIRSQEPPRSAVRIRRGCELAGDQGAAYGRRERVSAARAGVPVARIGLPGRLGAVVLATAIPFGAGVAQKDIEPLLERAQADQAALQRATADFEDRSARGQLGTVEKTDYLAYLARLRSRLTEDCAALAAAGVAALPADLPCAGASVAGIAPSHDLSEPSPAERAAGLEDRFRAGLSQFDQMLLQEQERVKARSSRSGGGASSSAGSGGSGSGSESASKSASAGGRQGQPVGAAETESAADESGGRTVSGQGGLGGRPRPGAQGAPPDVADASGDDVVARQLREAAEKEQDPELKEKLWEEYRKYKRGAGK